MVASKPVERPLNQRAGTSPIVWSATSPMTMNKEQNSCAPRLDIWAMNRSLIPRARFGPL